MEKFVRTTLGRGGAASGVAALLALVIISCGSQRTVDVNSLPSPADGLTPTPTASRDPGLGPAESNTVTKSVASPKAAEDVSSGSVQNRSAGGGIDSKSSIQPNSGMNTDPAPAPAGTKTKPQMNTDPAPAGTKTKPQMNTDPAPAGTKTKPQMNTDPAPAGTKTKPQMNTDPAPAGTKTKPQMNH